MEAIKKHLLLANYIYPVKRPHCYVFWTDFR